MAEYFYREINGVSRRLVGPFDSSDEARKAARYKGIRDVEVLKKNGPSYDAIDQAGVPKPA